MEYKYIGSKNIEKQIRKFIDRRIDYLKKNDYDRYIKTINKFWKIKTRNNSTNEEIPLSKKIKSFNDWKRKAHYQIKYFDLIFDKETLAAELNDIFGEEPIVSFDNRQHNFYQMMSITSVRYLFELFKKQLNDDINFFDYMLDINNITLPVMYHLTTQSFLLVRFNLQKRDINSFFYEYLFISLKNIELDNSDKNLKIIISNIETRNPYQIDIKKTFKSYSSELTKKNRIKTLANYIVSVAENVSKDEKENYMRILKDPLFSMYRNVEMLIKEEETKQIIEFESSSELINKVNAARHKIRKV